MTLGLRVARRAEAREALDGLGDGDERVDEVARRLRVGHLRAVHHLRGSVAIEHAWTAGRAREVRRGEESRGEQSRGEQKRVEQRAEESRGEQSREQRRGIVRHLVLALGAEVHGGDICDDGGSVLLDGLVVQMVHHRVDHGLDAEIPVEGSEGSEEGKGERR